MSGDEQLISAYREGKDLYAHIGQLALKVPYEDCLEHRPDGSVNPEGKLRRNKMKAIVLALMYGKGAKALSEDLKISLEEAINLMENFFNEFPKVKDFIDKSKQFAKLNGYVTTNWGRKRRLPDMMLEEYSYSFANGSGANFDPLEDFEKPVEIVTEVPQELKDKWNKRLTTQGGRYQRMYLFQEAYNSDKLKIIDNTKRIADAERQTVNSRIQGSAGDMTKLASIIIFNDKRLQERDCHILIWVHDEVIVTCPIKYAKECAEFLSEDMKKSGEGLAVPMKCDTEITKIWYGEELKF